MKIHTYILIGLLALCSASCGHGANAVDNNKEAGGDAAAPNQGSVMAGNAPAELPMPAVPDSLRTVEERAAYVALHYWDSMDFRNHALSLDTAFVEQNFANFAAILQMALPADAEKAIRTLLDSASVDVGALNLMSWTAEKYLDEPNSPMRDEETYIHFLRYLSTAQALDEYERLRPAHRLREALRNRRGTVATDFEFVDRSGASRRLSEAVRRSEVTLLIFYDPDCEHCKEIIDAISRMSFTRGVGVLAIDAEDDAEAWENTKGALPTGWTVGFATTPILERELYTLPASPTLYVLAADGTVILKDPAPEQAVDYLRNLR